jgi:hypothetical protein
MSAAAANGAMTIPDTNRSPREGDPMASSNPIQGSIRSRLAAVQARADEAGSVPHMGLRGQLREACLLEFFRGVIPQALQVTSGFICDASGATSTQLDLIVIDPYLLPAMSLSADISLVPVEAALLTAEIKSTLDTDALEQVAGQRSQINRLRFTHEAEVPSETANPPRFILPSFVLAYECQVSEERMRQFMTDNRDVLGICVIGKLALLQLEPVGVTTVNASEAMGPFWETLAFVGKTYRALSKIRSERNIRPDWERYMQGVLDTARPRVP